MLAVRPSLLALLLASNVLALAAADPAELAAACDLFESGQLTKAHATFSTLAAADPALAEAQRYLGWIALRRNDPTAAVKHLERACALDPSSSTYAQQLGDAYGLAANKAGLLSKMGWARKCKAAFERAIALDPKNVDARWALMEYFKQAPGIAGGSFALAHAQAEAILALNPSAGRFAKAGVLAGEGKIDEAFALYDGILTAETGDYAALSQFGQLCKLTGKRCSEGVVALQKCLTMTPPRSEPRHVAVHGFIGRLHEILGDKAAARAAYQAALALDPYFAPATEALAKLK